MPSSSSNFSGIVPAAAVRAIAEMDVVERIAQRQQTVPGPHSVGQRFADMSRTIGQRLQTIV